MNFLSAPIIRLANLYYKAILIISKKISSTAIGSNSENYRLRYLCTETYYNFLNASCKYEAMHNASCHRERSATSPVHAEVFWLPG